MEEHQLLSNEVERLREALLLQLRELRWDVVDMSITDVMRAIAENDGVVDLRLRVSSQLWSEQRQRAERKGEAVKEEPEQSPTEQKDDEEQHVAVVIAQPPQSAAEKNALAEESIDTNNDHEESARKLWLELKEQARQKVFEEVRREQTQRILAARNIKLRLGLKTKEVAAADSAKISPVPLSETKYADDPFPLEVPLSPRMENPLGSPIPTPASTNLRAIAVGTHIPTSNWQAELRPGLLFEVDARLDLNPSDEQFPSGILQSDEWWIGRKFDDTTGLRKAVPARYLHVLSGYPAFLPSRSMKQLLESLPEEPEKLNTGNSTVVQLPDRRLPDFPPNLQPSVARSDGSAPLQTMMRTPILDAELIKPTTELVRPDAGAQNIETNSRQDERAQPTTAPKPIPISRPPSYNMMPIPVISSEIAAAIKDRERRKSQQASLTADSPAFYSTSEERGVPEERRRSATTLAVPRPNRTADEEISGAPLRPLPPPRLARRSLDPSSPAFALEFGAPEGAPPPLPPVPVSLALPDAIPPSLSAESPAPTLPSTIPIPASSHFRSRPVSMPPNMLAKMMNEEAAAAAGLPPALPPMPTNIQLAPTTLTAIPPAASGSNSQLPTAAHAIAARSMLVDGSPLGERKRSATVVGTEVGADRTSSSPVMPRHGTLRSSKRRSKGSDDLISSSEAKEKKKEKKKKKEEEKEKKRKEKEKKKEEKKKKKDRNTVAF